MRIEMDLLLLFLVICAVAVCFTKNLMISVIILMSYSLVMSLLWWMLEAPDLCITEAAVGAGVTTVLFFIAMRSMHEMDMRSLDKAYEEKEPESSTQEAAQAVKEVQS